MAMIWDYDCRCPICFARARGLWPAFVEQAPAADVEPVGLSPAPYTSLADLVDKAIADAVLGYGLDP